MTLQSPSSARVIYLAASKQPDEVARQAFLNDACGRDQVLRAHVEKLLSAASALSDNPLQAMIDELSIEIAWEFSEAADTNLSHPAAMGMAESCDAQIQGPIEASKHPMIGPYELLEEIGHGGMGVVYMAQQTQPVNRQVALKVIKPGMDTREVIARFEVERQALAMMDHTHIARVLDGGTTDEGRPYFVMELVRGVPLTDFCNAKKLKLRERLELFIHVCNAVQHAHQKGIIHRDLKPSNLLVTLHDGVPVVKVIDFGVAKALNQELTDLTLFTQFSQMIGTPLYMAPEQAEISGLDIDTRCDIYSLGVVLYEVLTGTTPFDRDTLSNRGIEGIRRLIIEQDPQRPSIRMSTLKAANHPTTEDDRSIDTDEIAKQLKRELDWIVMKAMEKDREQRYESATALAEDVQRYLDDEPVQACPPSISYFLMKHAKRNKGLLTTALIVMATLLTFTVVSGVFAVRLEWEAERANQSESAARTAQAEAEAQTQLAVEQAERAEQANTETQLALHREAAQRHRAESALYVADIRLAAAKSVAGAKSEALGSLLRHYPIGTRNDQRSWEWYYLLNQANESLLTWKASDSNIPDIDWSPDGKRIASAQYHGGTNIWDAETGEFIQSFTQNKMINLQVEWHADSEQLAWGCAASDPNLRIWHAKTDKVDEISANTRSLLAVSWSPDGNRIAVGALDENQREEPWMDRTSLVIWNRANEEWVLHKKLATGSSIRKLKWNSDGSRIIIVSRKKAILVEPESLSFVHEYEQKDIASVGWHRSLDHIALGTTSGETIILDAGTHEEFARFSSHDGEVRCVEWSPDSVYLATCANDGLVRIWRTEDWSLVSSYSGHDGIVNAVTWSPDSKKVASSGHDGRINIWSIASEPPRYEFTNPLNPPRQFNRFAWTEDGLLRIALTQEGMLDCNPRTGEVRQTFALTPGRNWQLLGRNIAFNFREFHPETRNADVAVFGIPNPSPERNIKLPIRVWGHWDATQIIYTTRWDENLFIYDLKHDEQFQLGDERLVSIADIDWSNDKKYIAVFGGGRKSDHETPKYAGWVHLFDSATHAAIDRRQIGKNRILACSGRWSPDSRRLVAGTGDGLCEVFSVPGLRQLCSQRVHRLKVTSLSWHPDQKRIASGSADRTVAVWDSSTGKVLIRFWVEANVRHVEWSPDGKILAASDVEDRHYVWDATQGYAFSRSASFTDRITHYLESQFGSAIAAEDYAAAKELGAELLGRDRSSYLGSYVTAVVRRQLNNQSGYQLHCKQMLTTFADSDIPRETHFTAWTCALAPNALDDYEPAIKLARHAVEKAPGNPQYLNGLGGILMRAGEHTEAKVHLNTALKSTETDSTSRSYARYFLAMTEHHLSNTDAAQEHLQAAIETSEKELADSPPRNHKLTLEVLRQEAEALITPAPQARPNRDENN